MLREFQRIADDITKIKLHVILKRNCQITTKGIKPTRKCLRNFQTDWRNTLITTFIVFADGIVLKTIH